LLRSSQAALRPAIPLPMMAMRMKKLPIGWTKPEP
jgi:hypothetical protein